MPSWVLLRFPPSLSPACPHRLALLGLAVADWFKTYNDELDSKGMQFAITECPSVIAVWQVIKSEASKNRNAKFKWQDADFELIGFARKINVSVPIFNECLKLLERAKFITRHNGHMIVTGWDRLQSDYARGLDKGYYNSKKTRKKLASKSEKLASNSLVSTTRREERRVEESTLLAPAATNREIEWEQAKGWLANWQSNGADYTERETRSAFLALEASGWMWGRNPVADPRAALERQIQTDRQRNNHGNNKPNTNDRSFGIKQSAADKGKEVAEILRRRELEKEMAETKTSPP